MNKTGFLVKVTAKDREYFYLRRSFRDEKKRTRNKSFYSFGSAENAVMKLTEWAEDVEKMPGQLKIMGFGIEDVLLWLEQIKKFYP